VPSPVALRATGDRGVEIVGCSSLPIISEITRFLLPDLITRTLQINDEYIAAQNYRADIHDLHFVRTDNLNRGLYDFLIRMEYPEEDVRFILDLGKILPQGKGRTKGQKWEKYYTPELRQRVRRSDRLIFTMFPEFDV
jgi:hypothetical protein